MKPRFCLTLTILALVACACQPPAADPAPIKSGEPAKAAMEPVLHIAGALENGELGFRFESPLDVDGDGVDDIAAGTRFDGDNGQNGAAHVWSGADGKHIHGQKGQFRDGMLGQSVVLLPDVNGDGLADVIMAAPAGHTEQSGILYAYSTASKSALWTRHGKPRQNLGWDMAVAEDHNGDGVADLFVGAPGREQGEVHLISGRTGETLQVYTSGVARDAHGWRLSTVPDLDGDGRQDFVVGAPMTTTDAGHTVGAARVMASGTGKVLHRWEGAHQGALFGEMVCGLGDLNGDGRAEIAVSAVYTRAEEGPLEGTVTIYSGADGAVLRHWKGRQRGELYGRMLSRAGDYDGDGIGDLAIGAPWHEHAGAKRAGRFEIRSGATGEILTERVGSRPSQWLGWHMAPGQRLGPGRRPGLVVASLRAKEGGLEGAGALDIFVYPQPSTSNTSPPEH